MGYDEFENEQEVTQAYRRKRTSQTFCLTDKAISMSTLTCENCRQPITLAPWNGQQSWQHPPSNHYGYRGIYTPQHKTVQHFHYDCLWIGTLEEVVKLQSVLA